jgi:putative membrane-bound dehydrogenase-like protein
MSRKTALRALAVLGVVAVTAAAWFYFRPSTDPHDSADRLQLHTGDRVVIVGNAFAERMQYFGHFETLLHSRFPDRELVVRNLGYSGDEVTTPTSRAVGFFERGFQLADLKPDVVIACFGFNESFAGPGGLQPFEESLDKFVTQVTTPPGDGRAPPRLVIVSPTAVEDRPGPADGRASNKNLRLYTEVMRAVAARREVKFVDLFGPSQPLLAAGRRLTVNGVHLTDEGDREVAALLDEGLFGPRPAAAATADYDRLRAAVNEKNLQFWYDYRAANVNFISGAHKEGPNKNYFPAEFAKLRRMIENRDRRVWAVARGEAVPDRIDDSDTGELPQVATALKERPRLLPPDEAARSFTLAPGFEISLYASEADFPDLRKPVAMAFDARGRLWVTTMPSYPMYLPGHPVNDKLLVLEDPAGTGRATKATVFADGLYLPTGLALGDGGAYVGCQPNVWFLKDTKGTGTADVRERILTGFGNADVHRAVNTFRWGPGGELFFNEGIYIYSQVETPYGLRQMFHGGSYRFQPKTGRLDVHVTFRMGNPWGHAWDRWGQEFLTDAADGSGYYATAVSGDADFPYKHPPGKEGAPHPDFHPKQWRPTCASVIVSGRQFPDDWRGDYLVNNTLNVPDKPQSTVQGVVRYKVKEDGSGFAGTPGEPLLQSSDPNFRPIDLCFGPDGALYLTDWYDPIVNYMVYPLRDPNRDQTHGRIWRITRKGGPPVPAPKVAGAPISELLDLLKAPEDATRDQARRELRGHDAGEVTAALERWLAGLDPKDPRLPHHQMEGLWVCQQLDAVNDGLLRRLLRSSEPRARAAATRVLWAWRDRVPDALALLRTQATDDHPRVRLEAVRALSFYRSSEAREAVQAAAALPQDNFLKYVIQEALATLDRRLGGAR